MKVTLQLRGPLVKKLLDGFFEIELENDAKLSDLLIEMIQKEESIRKMWASPEVVDRDALILCNETDVGLGEGLDTKLNDGDVIVVLPLIHGG